MKRGLGLSGKEMGDVFAQWNKGVLDSFLIEITRDILYYNDDDDTPLVEKILDSAGQKGTGKWTAINALDMGQPVTLIGEAVFARCLSSLKGERGRASEKLSGPKPNFTGDKKEFLANLEQALYASKIISYAQGFMLMQSVRHNFILVLWYLTNNQHRLPRSTAGSSRSQRSPSCGAEAASSAPSSSRTSPRPTAQTQTSRTCSLTTSSTRPSTPPSPAGATLSPRVLFGESPPQPSPPLCPSSTVSAPRIYPPTFSRLSVITLVPTLSALSQSMLARSTQRARTSTLTGLDVVVTSLLPPTLLRVLWTVLMDLTFIATERWYRCPPARRI